MREAESLRAGAVLMAMVVEEAKGKGAPVPTPDGWHVCRRTFLPLAELDSAENALCHFSG